MTERPGDFADWADDDWGWDQATGAPRISLFGSAVQVWSAMQGEPVSVQQAADAFKVPPRRIIQAVEEHSWMFLSGPMSDDYAHMMIEHDGE